MKPLLLLTLLSVLCGTLGFIWEQSSCSNDRQCPSVQRRGCPGCFLGFIGIQRTVSTFRGRCINYDHGPLCALFGGGNRCRIRKCLECYENVDCSSAEICDKARNVCYNQPPPSYTYTSTNR